MISVGFEVFGRVQGVFFRRYTQKEAQSLGLRGWCKNTRQDTVIGEMEGPEDKVNEMKIWLKTKGSPQSLIDRVDFSNEKVISDFTFKDFEIRH